MYKIKQCLNLKLRILNPIFVAGVANISPLTTLFESIAKNEYEIKIMNNTQIKIQSNTSEKYTAIVKELQVRNIEFHTYRQKHERSFRVILKTYIPLST